MDNQPIIPPINKGNVTYNSPNEAFFKMPWPRKPTGKGGTGKASHGMAKGNKGSRASKGGRSRKSH